MVVNGFYRWENPQDWISAHVRIMRVGVVDHDFDDVMELTYFNLDALRRSLAYWTRTPVTIRHPAEFITNAWDASIIGAIEDPRIEAGEFLAATAWMYRPQLPAELLRRIEARDPIETSGGYYAHTVPNAGTFRGERFSRVAHSLVANHLAILPSTVGAFGLRRGCGMNPVTIRRSSGIVTNATGSIRRGKVQPNPLRAARHRPRIEPSPVPPPTPTSRFL